MNEQLMKRMCQLITISYALPEGLVWEVFCKINSIDKILDIIKDSPIERCESELTNFLEVYGK